MSATNIPTVPLPEPPSDTLPHFNTASPSALPRPSTAPMSEAHTCPYVNCRKSFSKKYNLKAHLRLHTGELPFVCDRPNCKKKFKWRSSLSSHAVWHSRKESASISSPSKKQPSSISTPPTLSNNPSVTPHLQRNTIATTSKYNPISPALSTHPNTQVNSQHGLISKASVIDKSSSNNLNILNTADKLATSQITISENICKLTSMSPASSTTFGNDSEVSAAPSTSTLCSPIMSSNVSRSTITANTSNVKRPRSAFECTTQTDISGMPTSMAQTSCDSIFINGTISDGDAWANASISRAKANRQYRQVKKRKKATDHVEHAKVKKRLHAENILAENCRALSTSCTTVTTSSSCTTATTCGSNNTVSATTMGMLKQESCGVGGNLKKEEDTLVAMDLLGELPTSPVTSHGSGKADVFESDLFNLPVLPTLFTRNAGSYEFGGSEVNEMDGSGVDEGFFEPLPLDCRLDGFEMEGLPGTDV